MFFQLDMIDSQLMERPDGSIEIHGRNGYIVINAEYAKDANAAYQKFLESYPDVSSLKIAVNIELSQPTGQFHWEGAASA